VVRVCALRNHRAWRRTTLSYDRLLNIANFATREQMWTINVSTFVSRSLACGRSWRRWHKRYGVAAFLYHQQTVSYKGDTKASKMRLFDPQVMLMSWAQRSSPTQPNSDQPQINGVAALWWAHTTVGPFRLALRQELRLIMSNLLLPGLLQIQLACSWNKLLKKFVQPRKISSCLLMFTDTNISMGIVLFGIPPPQKRVPGRRFLPFSIGITVARR
jgi:hypothetical protein